MEMENKKEVSKSQMNLQYIYFALFNEFGFNKQFTYRQAQLVMINKPEIISVVQFYDMTNIGIITVVKRGIFLIPEIEFTFDDVYKRCNEWRSGRSKHNASKKNHKPEKQVALPFKKEALVSYPDYTVQGCIAFLKARQYKILMPLPPVEPQYKEV
jgi:hypothetical protein